MTAPGRATRRRLRELEIRPDRDLGQNFLVDDNLLGVIERLAELTLRDRVLEVGGGLGTLSERLLPLVDHLHVVEVDPRLRAALEQALAPFANVTLHMADAARLDLRRLSPSPTKVVANLPYGVAARVLIRTALELEGVERWVCMVQLEVARRLVAEPGSRVYGATSAITGLCCEGTVDRRVGPAAFHPRPNVDSALFVMRRTGPPPDPAVVALIHAAFAHRRKTLGASLALAPGAGSGLREAARSALVEVGHREDTRAERLSSEDFVRLAAVIGPERLGALAPAR